MHSVTSIIGSASAGVAILAAIFSVIYLRKQTHIMASQLGKEIEIKITRDLEGPDDVDSKLRTYLNRRLSEVRSGLRQEFNPQLEGINRLLDDNHIRERKDIAEVVLRFLDDGKDAVAIVKESNGKLSSLEQELQSLQRAVAEIRSGVGNQAMVRAQIRGIAEQLLRMAGQEQPTEPSGNAYDTKVVPEDGEATSQTMGSNEFTQWQPTTADADTYDSTS